MTSERNSVFCFGNDSNGELALRTEEDHILKPQKLRLLHDRRKMQHLSIASGRNHTLVLLRNIALERNISIYIFVEILVLSSIFYR